MRDNLGSLQNNIISLLCIIPNVILAGCKQFKLRPISQAVFLLSIAINGTEHVCATVTINHIFHCHCHCHYRSIAREISL